MSRVSEYRKFLEFMIKSGAASFGLGVFSLCFSRGFGPCGPTDSQGALGILACLLGMAGSLIFFVPFIMELD